MRKSRKTKLRKSTRYFYIAVAIALLIMAIIGLIKSLRKQEVINFNREIYSYQNQFNYNYKVNLVDNKYIDEKTLDMGKVYVTDLIDDIDINFDYLYSGSINSSIDYKYKVLGKLQAAYTKDGEKQKVWDKDYVLLEESTNKEETDKIKINDEIKLDLKQQNRLVKDFEKEMNMSLDAIYTVIFEVETDTNIENRPVANKYISTLAIDLGEKTTKIVGENAKKETEYVTKEISKNVDTNKWVAFVYTALIVVALAIIKYILANTTVVNKIKNDYRKELNRILRLCQDKIVQVSGQIEINKDNVVDVKDFGEIIKISEELFKPILCWESDKVEEAWFVVMSNQVTYRYILKK